MSLAKKQTRGKNKSLKKKKKQKNRTRAVHAAHFDFYSLNTQLHLSNPASSIMSDLAQPTVSVTASQTPCASGPRPTMEHRRGKKSFFFGGILSTLSLAHNWTFRSRSPQVAADEAATSAAAVATDTPAGSQPPAAAEPGSAVEVRSSELPTQKTAEDNSVIRRFDLSRP